MCADNELRVIGGLCVVATYRAIPGANVRIDDIIESGYSVLVDK